MCRRRSTLEICFVETNTYSSHVLLHMAGHILVRESGTEPLVRVMIEASDHDICQKYVSQVVEVIKNQSYCS